MKYETGITAYFFVAFASFVLLPTVLCVGVGMWEDIQVEKLITRGVKPELAFCVIEGMSGRDAKVAACASAFRGETK